MSGQMGVMVVGPGRMGLALGYALSQADALSELAVCGRRPEPPAHPIFTQRLARYVFGLERPGPGTEAVFLAVPDGAIPEMAHALAGQGDAPPGCAAYHLSGVLPTDVLAPLHERGYHVGSFRPLQTVGHPVRAARRLPGSWIAVTGSPTAVSVARRLAGALESPVLTVPEAWRPRYHAATVLAASLLSPLLDSACRVLESAGVAHEDALPALLPMVRGALENIAEEGVSAAAGGPAATGDLEALDLHLRSLDGPARRLYATLARESARMADEDVSAEWLEAVMERLEAEGE